MQVQTPTPITILTGFLGSGKTTLILNLLPQLPPSYNLALLKNEFGDVAVDSQLASRSSISGVRELLNGCICCNLVGQLGDALKSLRAGADPSAAADEGQDVKVTTNTARRPDRIIIETSGSAFPATLAMEVNRISRETGDFTLDGVVSVIDVENWQGYEDASVTAKMQAKYTDLIIMNKWEEVSERKLDDVLDRIGDLDLDPPVPCMKSKRGIIEKEAILGLDGALARTLGSDSHDQGDHKHDDEEMHHQGEVEVVSAILESSNSDDSLDLSALHSLLMEAPKDEVYRIKAILRSTEAPKSSDGDSLNGSVLDPSAERPCNYILNWAFGRWTFTKLEPHAKGTDQQSESVLRMTIVTARYESSKWVKRIESQGLLRIAGDSGKSFPMLRRVS